jgi:hypothetical protein
MRYRWGFGVLLVISLLVGSRDASAEGQCLDVLCGMKCITHDVNYGGYCNFPAPETTGCVQMFGPDCGSMSNTHCCTTTGGAGGF